MKICIVGAGPSSFYLTKYLNRYAPQTEIHIFEKALSPLPLLHLFQTKTNLLFDENVKCKMFCGVKVSRDMLPSLDKFYDGIVIATGGKKRRLDGIGKYTVYAEDVLRLGSDYKMNNANNTHSDMNGNMNNINSNNTRSTRLLQRILQTKCTDTSAHPFSCLKRVAIIGAGNVSLDTAHLLLSHGVRKVFVLGRGMFSAAAFDTFNLRETIRNRHLLLKGCELGSDRKSNVVKQRLHDQQNGKTVGSTIVMMCNTLVRSIKDKMSTFCADITIGSVPHKLRNLDMIISSVGYVNKDLSKYVSSKPLYSLGWCKHAKGDLSTIKYDADKLGNKLIRDMQLK